MFLISHVIRHLTKSQCISIIIVILKGMPYFLIILIVPTYTAPSDFIDLKKALKIDYDTLYLISGGFESDISDIIGFKYNGGDFTLEAEDNNLLLLVKNDKIVYQDKISRLRGKVCFFYPFWRKSPSICLLKHSSSIYKVERERNGLLYSYYLYNVPNSDVEK